MWVYHALLALLLLSSTEVDALLGGRIQQAIMARKAAAKAAAAGTAAPTAAGAGTAAAATTAPAAAAAGMDCVVTVPPNPFTAQGLATPYTQTGCTMTDTPSFVEAIVMDMNTGALSVYHPLVIDQGTQPAIPPVTPTLPANAMVALYFGTNGATLTLTDTDNGATLKGAACVNGVNLQGGGFSIFGQFASCNGAQFMAAAQQLIQNNQLQIPALGTAVDGLPCMTTRDFGLVDQDPSDNVNTQYLLTADNKVAQNTAANRQQLGANAKPISNGSDNIVLNNFVDVALRCTSPTAPDLTDNNNPVSALALNELFALKNQVNNIALVPAGDPMVTVVDANGNTVLSLTKMNAYREQVGQPKAASLADPTADTATFCRNLLAIGVPRLKGLSDMGVLQNVGSLDPAVATNLQTFLGNRFNNAWGADNLNCQALINIPSPVTVTNDANGVTVQAVFTPVAGATASPNLNQAALGGAGAVIGAGAGQSSGGASSQQQVQPRQGAIVAVAQQGAAAPGAAATNLGAAQTAVNNQQVAAGAGAGAVIVGNGAPVAGAQQQVAANTIPPACLQMAQLALQQLAQGANGQAMRTANIMPQCAQLIAALLQQQAATMLANINNGAAAAGKQQQVLNQQGQPIVIGANGQPVPMNGQQQQAVIQGANGQQQVVVTGQQPVVQQGATGQVIQGSNGQVVQQGGVASGGQQGAAAGGTAALRVQKMNALSTSEDDEGRMMKSQEEEAVPVSPPPTSTSSSLPLAIGIPVGLAAIAAVLAALVLYQRKRRSQQLLAARGAPMTPTEPELFFTHSNTGP